MLGDDNRRHPERSAAGAKSRDLGPVRVGWDVLLGIRGKRGIRGGFDAPRPGFLDTGHAEHTEQHRLSFFFFLCSCRVSRVFRVSRVRVSGPGVQFSVFGVIGVQGSQPMRARPRSLDFAAFAASLGMTAARSG